eukprot:982946-Alexandrium_andersonii.AAC.1
MPNLADEKPAGGRAGGASRGDPGGRSPPGRLDDCSHCWHSFCLFGSLRWQMSSSASLQTEKNGWSLPDSACRGARDATRSAAPQALGLEVRREGGPMFANSKPRRGP